VRKILITPVLFGLFFFWEISQTFSDKGKEDKYYAHINSFNDFSIPIENKSVSYQLKNKLSRFDQASIIDTQVNELLENNEIKGASVAVAHDGKLVYAKGFGYANFETGEMVEPKHLFRIASVSKLITAVAVMKLVEDGKLKLDDRAFGDEGILIDSCYMNYTDPNIEKITIKMLLNHTAGWFEKYGDPVFTPFTISRQMNDELPISIQTLIEYALLFKLANEPGEEYNYSNLSYVILGEIIAKVTNMGYEDYVQSSILNPIGIYDMHLGKSFYDERARNEVKYYLAPGIAHNTYAIDGSGKRVPEPYGGNDIEILGAAGGWIASAPELMKFILAVDGYNDVPDILSNETIKLMVTPDDNRYTLLGWRGTDNRGTWWRTGTLAGTSALVVRQNNNMVWLVLLNTSTPARSRIHSVVSSKMFRAVYKVKEWPDYDLFEYGLPKPIKPIMMAQVQ